jgi:hypothetical protein
LRHRFSVVKMSPFGQYDIQVSSKTVPFILFKFERCRHEHPTIRFSIGI